MLCSQLTDSGRMGCRSLHLTFCFRLSSVSTCHCLRDAASPPSLLLTSILLMFQALMPLPEPTHHPDECLSPTPLSCVGHQQTSALEGRKVWLVLMATANMPGFPSSLAFSLSTFALLLLNNVLSCLST